MKFRESPADTATSESVNDRMVFIRFIFCGHTKWLPLVGWNSFKDFTSLLNCWIGITSFLWIPTQAASMKSCLHGRRFLGKLRVFWSRRLPGHAWIVSEGKPATWRTQTHWDLFKLVDPLNFSFRGIKLDAKMYDKFEGFSQIHWDLVVFLGGGDFFPDSIPWEITIKVPRSSTKYYPPELLQLWFACLDAWKQILKTFLPNGDSYPWSVFSKIIWSRISFLLEVWTKKAY